MSIHRDQVFELCKLIAPKYEFDPFLILAICGQEAEKMKGDALMYRGDVARLEQGFYRRYTEAHTFATTTEILLAASYGIPQMMGQSLLELGWFTTEFNRQSEAYRKIHGEPTSETNIPKALNRYCVDFSEQIDTACQHLAKKRKAVGPDVSRFLLAWNGGSNVQYDDEVLARVPILKKVYGG